MGIVVGNDGIAMELCANNNMHSLSGVSNWQVACHYGCKQKQQHIASKQQQVCTMPARYNKQVAATIQQRHQRHAPKKERKRAKHWQQQQKKAAKNNFAGFVSALELSVSFRSDFHSSPVPPARHRSIIKVSTGKVVIRLVKHWCQMS